MDNPGHTPVPQTADKPVISVRSAMRFVVLLGIVSLLSDATYEGARSITGPFLETLKASAAVVGIVAGAGELLGYALRLFSGLLSDKTGRYWLITIVGYAVNLLAVPVLALAGNWPVAAALMIAERVGKALRTPARDAMLADATGRVGHGWGFGIHEALDQIGAILGPLIVAGVLAVRGEYRTGFAVLLIPALMALAVLGIARYLYPRPHDLEVKTPDLHREGLSPVYWTYLAGAALVGAGFADFPLVAYHIQKTGMASETVVPILYALAMGVDAVAALGFGRLFDRIGVRVLAMGALLSAGFAPLVFLGGFAPLVAGVLLWGIGMGAQESVMRAALATMAPRERRASAYGVFNACFGVAWFLGSALMGVLYDRSVFAVAVFSAAMQLAAAPVLLRVAATHRQGSTAG